MMPLVCHPVVPGMTLPVVGSILGALAGSYDLGSKLLICPLVSVGCPKKDHRMPIYTFSRAFTLKSSCAYNSCCHAQTSGVRSCEGWLKLATLPNRKLANDCWNELVPVTRPAFEKVNDP